ncbi:MAG: peptidoglycan DD-metalloendopeptidase family protein [Flavobacteriia bacterium]|nr:peptidoglycan DD-metalloendopeptidase family protein [Flavobacteriia bacterium]
MKWKKNTIRFAVISGLLAIVAIAAISQFLPEDTVISKTPNAAVAQDSIEARTLYGIEIDDFDITEAKIESGETFGAILDRYGVPSTTVFALSQFDSIFDIRYVQLGKPYKIFQRRDSLNTAEYLVYEESLTEYVVFHLADSIWVETGQREITIKRREAAGVIRGSLYLSLQEQDVSPVLAVKLSEIYAWTIDFFRIQEGDTYRVIFEEEYIDDTIFVGTGRIIASSLTHMGEEEYAFAFMDTTYGTMEYYDNEGQSLRKAFLRAPLQFGRISSRYTRRRFHPVQKRWKPHLGTDYAAPAGTPILATADGVVERAGYTSGNGNYVKIRHNSVYSTQYLHMRAFARGMKAGVRVKQGEVIGYVGSTGLATGPHVCYRFWKNGVQVDPLRQKLPDAEPIAEELRPTFLEFMQPLKAELDALPIQDNQSEGQASES